MTQKNKNKKILLGSALAGLILAAPNLSTTGNFFQTAELEVGYRVAQADHHEGENKEEKKKKKEHEKKEKKEKEKQEKKEKKSKKGDKEGKSCGAGSCGGKDKKDGEKSCGAGSCG